MDKCCFTAVDFETICYKDENWEKGKFFICEIGIVVVRDGVIKERYSHRVKPPYDVFDAGSVRVHKIHPEDVANEPSFEQLWPSIMHYFCNTRLVAHNKSTEENILRRYIDELNLMDMGIGTFDDTYLFYKKKSLQALCAGFGIDIDKSRLHSAGYDAELDAEIAIRMYNNEQPDWSIVEQISPRRKKANSETYHKRISGDLLQKDLSGADPSNPFYDRKVVVTGVFAQDRSYLARWLKSMGADIDSGITKRTNFVLMGEDPGEKKVEALKKLSYNGYNIRVLDQFDVNQILAGVYGPYKSDKVNDKRLDFTMEHFAHHHLQFRDDYNVIASKELYVSKDVKGDRTMLGVVLGNLGAFDSNDLCQDTNVCVLSAHTVELLKDGIKDDSIRYIEDFYNNNRSVVFDFTFITDKDIIDYCRRRCAKCGDMLTMKILKLYIDSF